MTKEAVKRAIDAWDPMNIIFFDSEDMSVLNDDEYDFEVNLICRCVAKCGGSCSVEKLAEILRTVFSETFDEKNFTRDKTFEQVAEEILRDTSTGGTDVSEVKLISCDADAKHKSWVATVEEKILTQLFEEDSPAKRERLKVLEAKLAAHAAESESRVCW